MAFQKPIGDGVWHGRSQADKDRTKVHIEALQTLVPKENLREAFRAAIEADIQGGANDQTVLFSEADVAEIVAEAERESAREKPLSPEQQQAFDETVNGLKNMAGKTLAEFGPLGAEQIQQEIDESANNFVRLMVSGWINSLWLFTIDADDEKKHLEISLDDRLLPSDPPKAEWVDGFGSDQWINIVLCNASRGFGLLPIAAAHAAYLAFAERLRQELDKAADGYEIVTDAGKKLSIRKAATGYTLICTR